MSAIKALFDKLAAEQKKGLIVYLTAGDPNLGTSLEYMEAAVDAGADLLEVGVPFSDPSADGETIQEAAKRALSAGTTVAKVINLVRSLKKSRNVPVILFGYYNPFFSYGFARLCRDAKAAGVDGLLIVDVPLEETGELLPHTKAAGLDLIPLAAPTSGRDRIAKSTKRGSGFLYLISVTGITGVRSKLAPGLAKFVKESRSASSLPVAVGFGISTPEMAKGVAVVADAVVVGSACVKIVGVHGRDPKGPVALARFVKKLSNAIEGRP